LGETHWTKRPEVRARIQHTLSLKFQDASYKEERINQLNQSRDNPVTKEKMSVAKLGKCLTEEHKAKIKENADRSIRSEETKQLMSQGQAECWADPDRSAKRRESLKAAWADPVKKAERLAKRNETLRNKT
jgi:hypothetical protein